MVRIQTVCGFGCGSSLFLKMKVEEVLKEHNLEAEIFCGDVATCVSTPCDAIFISEELAERIKDRATVPVVVIKSFVNKNEVTEKTLAYFDSLK
ncbi:PTS sugar transporter subunit IIB [Clostridiaceae bacterium AF42-6]|jgi:conserved hypothetical protein|nr:PTS sugar transporter subunit IIB [Clostridiales bacterium AM23-16LB]RHO85086.1 PTS sugar transporter subunit IIB [Clostridiaceae bacterium AF42-6]RHP53292.1 PTS sugar transporter subunit IIB [Clostridiaceae bacterium AF31-3BH]RHR40331.1 PTS sugar transporter subunit IIB [Clostridiaceae bacterium AF18-31LB]RHV99994.1 PTS sugar transporter subunit IIB [Clostridiaceae bacterium OF09-1]